MWGRVCICAFDPDIFFNPEKKKQAFCLGPRMLQKIWHVFFFICVFLKKWMLWKRKIRDSCKLLFIKWFILLALENCKPFDT